MKKEVTIDPKLIGTYCIASDLYAGTYRAIIRGSHKGFSDLRIDVIIVECIIPPCDKAIINKEYTVHRLPYSHGSRQQFAVDQIKPLLEVTA